MKRYFLEVVIEEGSDGFWDSIPDDDPGCKEVVEMLREVLGNCGMEHGENCTVNLKRFES